jgi:glycosyltransferase involved in cell wall biosynthesis
MSTEHKKRWEKGRVPVAVVMIAFNESHHMEGVLQNLKGWAQEVFLVDSYSTDNTVDIALSHGVHVVQRRFNGFGDQWNYALQNLPVKVPWTMKLDPDERLSDELKQEIASAIENDEFEGLTLDRRLWFMGRPLPIRQKILRVWKTGCCRFTDVFVNEHPIVSGKIGHVKGYLEHFDSPNLHHWYEKQNRYSTLEAKTNYEKLHLTGKPAFFGSPIQRKMWLKSNFHRIPFFYTLLFLYNYIFLGSFRGGRVGLIWARLRSDVYRMRAYKYHEMLLLGTSYSPPENLPGEPHPKAISPE